MKHKYFEWRKTTECVIQPKIVPRYLVDPSMVIQMNKPEIIIYLGLPYLTLRTWIDHPGHSVIHDLSYGAVYVKVTDLRSCTAHIQTTLI